MRFMIIRKTDAATEAGRLPSTELLAAMGRYVGRMVEADVLRGAEGLLGSAKGVRLSFHDGRPTVTPGPFANPTDMVGGFFVIEVDNLDAAIDWAKQWPPEDADGAAQLEIRQIAEADDFGEAFTPELQDAEQAMREQVGR